MSNWVRLDNKDKSYPYYTRDNEKLIFSEGWLFIGYFENEKDDTIWCHTDNANFIVEPDKTWWMDFPKPPEGQRFNSDNDICEWFDLKASSDSPSSSADRKTATEFCIPEYHKIEHDAIVRQIKIQAYQEAIKLLEDDWPDDDFQDGVYYAINRLKFKVDEIRKG